MCRGGTRRHVSWKMYNREGGNVVEALNAVEGFYLFV